MAKEQNENPNKDEKKKKCGIIMPIANHPDYQIGHWDDVLEILKQSVSQTDFDAELVSNDGAVGLIQDTIVTNVFHNEIVICDVSSKNPNVMFELGMRLAFDKPTIIIKDDKTGYSFDIGSIEHITYPSSLRFADIIAFKEKLIGKIEATYKKSQDDGVNYSPFLRGFGQKIKASSIQPTEISQVEYMLGIVSDIKKELQALNNDRNNVAVKRANAIISKFHFPASAVISSGEYPEDENEKIKFAIDSMSAG